MDLLSNITQATAMKTAHGPAGRSALEWCLVESAPWLRVGEDGFVPEFPERDAIIVPLKLWQLRREDLLVRQGLLGVLLEPHDDPTRVVPDLPRFAVVAVDLRRLADDRGVMVARWLREQHGYRGELQAVIADVQCDQAAALFRHGFDTLWSCNEKNAGGTLAILDRFSPDRQRSVEAPISSTPRCQGDTVTA